MPPRPCAGRTPGSREPRPAPPPPARLKVARPPGPRRSHPASPGARGRWPPLRPGPGPPGQGRGLERSHGLGAACVRVSVCVCLCEPASPSAGASLSMRDQREPGRLPAQGDFRWGRGGSRGARELRGAAGTDQKHRAAGRRRGGTSLGSSGRSSLFPEFTGSRSPAWRRVPTAGCGPRRGRGLPAARTAPEAPEGSASSRALPSPPVSGRRAPRACWCPVPGLSAPGRASVWVQGVGVCVSVRQCVTGAMSWTCRLLRDAVGHPRPTVQPPCPSGCSVVMVVTPVSVCLCALRKQRRALEFVTLPSPEGFLTHSPGDSRGENASPLEMTPRLVKTPPLGVVVNHLGLPSLRAEGLLPVLLLGQDLFRPKGVMLVHVSILLSSSVHVQRTTQLLN